MNKRERKLDSVLRRNRAWLTHSVHRGRRVFAAACEDSDHWLYTLTDGTTCVRYWHRLADAERDLGIR